MLSQVRDDIQKVVNNPITGAIRVFEGSHRDVAIVVRKPDHFVTVFDALYLSIFATPIAAQLFVSDVHFVLGVPVFAHLGTLVKLIINRLSIIH